MVSFVVYLTTIPADHVHCSPVSRLSSLPSEQLAQLAHLEVGGQWVQDTECDLQPLHLLVSDVYAAYEEFAQSSTISLTLYFLSTSPSSLHPPLPFPSDLGLVEIYPIELQDTNYKTITYDINKSTKEYFLS